MQNEDMKCIYLRLSIINLVLIILHKSLSDVFINIGILLFVQVLHSFDPNDIMVKIQYTSEQRTRQKNNPGKKAQQLKPRNKARETTKIQHCYYHTRTKRSKRKTMHDTHYLNCVR